MIKEKPHCLLIYSGGLDSSLAVKVLEKQNIDVTAINFVSYFFGAGTAKKTAEVNNINLRIFDDEEWKKKHLQLVFSPKYGHGKAINPCVDCHLEMFRKAGEIMKEATPNNYEKIFGRPAPKGFRGFDFVASGEVLGQRPKSQNPRALKKIAKESGIEGYLIRPLCAKLLEPTMLEKEGLVDREQLLDINGRGRKRQIALAEELGLVDYPTPAGGCLLTSKEFAKRMFELIEKTGKENITENDINLTKIGRDFYLEAEPLSRVVLGRNQEENEKLKDLLQEGDVLIVPKNFAGPSALLRLPLRQGYEGQEGYAGQALLRFSRNRVSTGDKERGINEAKKIIFEYSKNIPDNLEFNIVEK